MKMEIERNNASILAYYGVEDRSADCQTFLFGTGEPVKLMFFRKLHQYIVCSLSVCLHCRSGSPFASVVRRLYGCLMQRVFMNLTHTVGKNESACFRSRSTRSRQPSGCSHCMRVPLHSLRAGWTLLR